MHERGRGRRWTTGLQPAVCGCVQGSCCCLDLLTHVLADRCCGHRRDSCGMDLGLSAGLTVLVPSSTDATSFCAHCPDLSTDLITMCMVNSNYHANTCLRLLCCCVCHPLPLLPPPPPKKKRRWSTSYTSAHMQPSYVLNTLIRCQLAWSTHSPKQVPASCCCAAVPRRR